MAFSDYAGELVGVMPKMPYLYAQKCVNRAWRSIRESRLWTFLVDETVLLSPSPITAGTVSVTFGSNLVVPDATAQAAFAAPGLPLITQRQFRVGTGPIYNIWAIDGPTGTLTLDRVYSEVTNAQAAYTIYRCYYVVPVGDFLRWQTVKDPVNGYPLKLNWTRTEVDRRDPNRQAFGNPTRVVAYKQDRNLASSTFGFSVYELWYHPQSQIGYQATYHRRGVDFVLPADSLPQAISESILMAGARYYAYEWAEANKGRFPELRGSDYPFLMGQTFKLFQAELGTAQRQDEETFLQNYIPPSDPECWMSPIDANYAQSHDTDWAG